MATILEQAASCIKAGDLENGKKLLVQVLQQNPSDENAWLWMSRCVPAVEQKKECFQRVLNINPYNPYAIEGLRRLDIAQNNSTLDEVLGPIKNDTKSKKNTQKRRSNFLVIAIISFVVLCLGATGIIGFYYWTNKSFPTALPIVSGPCNNDLLTKVLGIVLPYVDSNGQSYTIKYTSEFWFDLTPGANSNTLSWTIQPRGSYGCVVSLNGDIDGVKTIRYVWFVDLNQKKVFADDSWAHAVTDPMGVQVIYGLPLP